MPQFMKSRPFKALVASMALTATSAFAATASWAQASTQTLITGLDFPWAFAPLGTDRGLITERTGRLLYWNGASIAEIDHGLDVDVGGQGGLLDVLFHAPTSTVYLTYVKRGPGGSNTALASGRLLQNATGMVLTSVRTLFEAGPKTRGGRHFGSRLTIGGDGKLYMTLGDRGDHMEQSQNIGNHIGTVLRFNLDGTVPADNPFVGQAGAQPEIYSYGHRNPQGMATRPGDGTVWSHEHGPRGGDELNKLKVGANFGWPAITYGIDYDGSTISSQSAAPGMEQPVIYWTPSIAPSGMAFLGNDELYVGALRGRHLRKLTLDGDQVVSSERLLEELGARIRDVRNDGAGGLFVLIDDSAPDGALLRVSPN